MKQSDRVQGKQDEFPLKHLHHANGGGCWAMVLKQFHGVNPVSHPPSPVC